MSYECSCGATFSTLTKKRLHQRDACPDRDAEIDVSDLEAEAIAERAVDELLVCDVCERTNEGAETIEWDVTDAGPSVELRYTCEHCGAHNENTAILSEGSP